MVRIGVLLIELGTGELVWNVRLSEIGVRNEKFVFGRPGVDHAEHRKWKSLAAIIGVLNTTVGNAYATATANCLAR